MPSRPSTLSASERRWFVGRQTLTKAKEKYATINQSLLSTATLGASLELVETTAMLQLAEPDQCRNTNHVSVRPSAWLEVPGWTEFVLRVPVGRRVGRPRGAKGQTKQAEIKWKTNGASMGEKPTSYTAL